MPIQLSCGCGKKLRVKDELGGKRIKCPDCAKVIQVPAADLPEPEEAILDVAPPPLPPAGSEPTPFWVRSGELLALSDEALFLVSLDEEKLEEAQAALTRGDDAARTLGKSATVIPFADMKKVESNLHNDSIQVYWREPDASSDSDKLIEC